MALRKLRKTMKPVIWTVTIAFVISIFFIGAAGSLGSKNQGDALKVDGKKISQMKIERNVRNNIDRYQEYFKGKEIDQETIRLLTIGNLVETQFLMKEATSKEKRIEAKEMSDKLKEMTGMSDASLLKKRLKNTNITFKDIETDIREGIVSTRVRDRIKAVTPSAVEVEAYYTMNKASIFGNKSFDEVKKQAADELKQRNSQRIYNKWLEDKYSKTKITGTDDSKKYIKRAVMKIGSFEVDNIEFYNNVFYKKAYFGMTDDKSAFNSVIEGIKEDVAIADEAVARGLTSTEIAILAKQDKIEEYRNLLKDSLKKDVKYTDADLEKFFKDAPKGKYDQQESANIKAVMFKLAPSDKDKKSASDKAEAILKEVLAGKDFGELAKANSKDPGSAPNGGELGWFAKGQMVPEFETAAFETAKGTVYSKVVKTQFGYHIIKVEDKKVEDGKEQVKAQHILIKDEISDETKKTTADKANTLLADINAGKSDIDKAMTEKSEADTKEEIVNIKKGAMVEGLGYDKPLNDAIFAMKEGEIKVISTENGVYVVKQTKYVPFKAAVFADIKEVITSDYLNIKTSEMITAMKAEKKNSVKVEILDEKIKNAIK